jgi:hypothetical protein
MIVFSRARLSCRFGTSEPSQPPFPSAPSRNTGLCYFCHRRFNALLFVDVSSRSMLSTLNAGEPLAENSDTKSEDPLNLKRLIPSKGATSRVVLSLFCYDHT